jgi:hypothetical protein
MQTFPLTTSTPIKEFRLHSKNSRIFIHQVTLEIKERGNTAWQDVISSIQLKAEFSYVVYTDPAGKFEDTRTKEFPISLSIDPYQIRPVFNLRLSIENETFTIGNSSDEKFFTTLKILLLPSNLPLNRSLNFSVSLSEAEMRED